MAPWRRRGGPGPARIDLQTTHTKLTSSSSGGRADRRRASRRERARRLTQMAGKPRIGPPADPAGWRGIDRWVPPGGAPRLLHMRTNPARRGRARARIARPLARIPERPPAGEPAKTTTGGEKPTGSIVVLRAVGRRRRCGSVGRFRRCDVSAMRTIEGASRTTSIAVATRPSAASRGTRWREKAGRRKKKRENGGVDDGVARTCCGGILAGRRAIRPRTLPRSPQAMARGSAGGATSARRRREKGRTATRGTIAMGAA